MKFRSLIGIVFLFIGIAMYAEGKSLPTDSIHTNKQEIIDPDSLLQFFPLKGAQPQTEVKAKLTNSIQKPAEKIIEKKVSADEFEKKVQELAVHYYKIPSKIDPIKIDSLILLGNPLFIDLVFTGIPNRNKWNNPQPDFRLLYYRKPATTISDGLIKQRPKESAEEIIRDLRSEAREKISREAAHVYIMTFDQLPDPNGTRSQFIAGKGLNNIKFVEDDQLQNATNRKMFVKREQMGPWQKSANSLLQFSQNMASNNWYQGGNSTMSVLGVLCGKFNYDDKKKVQWENYGEWRMGFYSVFNDSTALRNINTNDDIFKINSKLGVKASGNIFYSGSVDFSTQFFHNYKSVNSNELKASFLTPVRLNIGVGLDYKYKKLFSLMVAPVSYKYIYVKDNVKVSPNLFGIKDNEHKLSEIGSSFKAQFSYSPFHELQIDSKLSFYTNYEKVEIDWEILGNFTINRFLSTRISINPRYDNTVIGEKALIQFKELISFGISYKLLN